MRETHQFDMEGGEVDGATWGHLGNHHLPDAFGALVQLASQQRGGEGRGIDRATQLRPQIGHGAHMVFVGMGEHEARQPLPAPGHEARVGHDEIDTGKLAAGESDAQVAHQPPTVIFVEVEVHADLAGTAQRQEVERGGHGQPAGRRLRCQTSHRPRTVTSGSKLSMTSLAASKSDARPPVAIVCIGLPYSARMRRTTPSIRPT